MALRRDLLTKLLEEERQKYYNETHQPTTHQLNRFSATCKLLKENLQVLRQNKSSTRQRKLTARENLEKISKLSSSVFALYSFFVTVSEIGQKSYLELIPKLRNWWRSVEHPERLLETVKDICELEGIEYVETVLSPKDKENAYSDGQSSAMEGSMFVYRDETPMLQVSLLPSEPPYQEVNITTRELIHFLQTSNSLTNRPATISLLKQYETCCPNLKLKLPWYSAFPSVEIKVTSDMGSSVALLFAWELANDLDQKLLTRLQRKKNFSWQSICLRVPRRLAEYSDDPTAAITCDQKGQNG
ncbi:hypothetical protein AJ78_05990 [Emergomyces pasteurianus Ep9510]|uniref:Uncharacterized protein n=2 Tax=Ajellomycetaceae TaxID=299071 RepID=A0A1J9PBZ9_9EURO|nr:hypothetical protein AJ78_05990 [Emergomyces pasteurianus Ep9510]